MRQIIQLALIMSLAVLGGVMWHRYNPPPAADYEVIYFCVINDADCKKWKRETLPEWRRDPASRSLPIRIAELYPGGPGPLTGGFGKYQDIFKQTHGKDQNAVYTRSDAMEWPRFVVLRDGEVYRHMHGSSGWRSVRNIARANNRRRENSRAKPRTAQASD